MDAGYRGQVDLLLRVLPHVAAEACFALKGGTALNLFVRDMPRLSVDLDLTYLPIGPREPSLHGIAEALDRIAAAATRALPGVRVARQGGAKLVATHGRALVKVEANTVIRGHLFPIRELDLCAAAQDEFGRFASTPVVSAGELYGGKLVAALDRQHPRDLFDAQFILDDAATAGGPDEELRLGFLVMLLSHDRPPHEVLDASEQDQADTFARQFAGMAREPFTLDDHRRAFADLRAAVPSLLPELHRDVLARFIETGNGLDQLARPEIADLPAVRWKAENLCRLLDRDPAKHAAQADALRDVLDSMPES